MERIQRKYKVEKPTARTSKESLANDIAQATVVKDKRGLAKRIMIAANTNKWSDTDLHALYQKRNDPNITNYTGFVVWAIKIKKV